MKSKVIEIGELAIMEEEPVLILFNDSAPPGLREVCIIHEFEGAVPAELLRVGSRIRFNDQEYEVLKIGHVANQTLQELGHISLYFDLGEEEILPGSAALSPHERPDIHVGDTIEFIT